MARYHFGGPQDRLVSVRKDGTKVRKHISAELRRRVPKDAQLAYKDNGAVGLVRWYRDVWGLSLSEAWAQTQDVRGWKHSERSNG